MAIRLSVIIPVYNTEKYLERCIQSVLEQNILDKEIILINDGSTDKSAEICDKYAIEYKNIIVIHKKNAGISSARNTGIEHAKGEYIMFLDSDDNLVGGSLKKLLDTASFNKSDLCISSFNTVFLETVSSNLFNERVYMTVEEFANDWHLYFATVSNFVWGKLYKKELILRNNIRFNPEITLGEDLLFNLIYYRRCKKIQVSNQCVVNYLQREGSITHKYINNTFELKQKYYNAIIKFLNEMNADSEFNINRVMDNMYKNYCHQLELLVQNKHISQKKKIAIIESSLKNEELLDCIRMRKQNGLNFCFVRKYSVLVYLIVKLIVRLRKIKKVIFQIQ